MDVAVKTRWLAALRSGDYKQGKRALRRGDTFCCLGVLCDILADELDLQVTHYGETRNRTTYNGEACLLPRAVTAAAGLHGDAPKVGAWSLTSLNDGGYTFPQIADAIEAHL